MVEVRDQQRQERAEARAGRRSDGGGPSDEGIDLKRAITTAVAAAVVGGLAGAAKAFADRQGRSSKPEEPERPPEPSSQADEPDDEEPEEEPDEQQGDEPSAEHQAEEPDEQEQEQEQEEQQPEPAAAPSGDVAKMVARARNHVEQVLGEEPEGVSGIERTNGNWCVNVEIVKLHRIPESTDVLASYAVVVDGDGDLVSLQETRRYRRSQAEDDR
jgi:outer membrane biosynthesis protein TonB